MTDRSSCPYFLGTGTCTFGCIGEPRCFTGEADPGCSDLPDTLDIPCCCDALAVLRRVVANESNHYDRYWTPPPGAVTDEWLDETEASMREALTDVFCDDAAAIMLTLIAEIRRLRRDVEQACYGGGLDSGL